MQKPAFWDTMNAPEWNETVFNVARIHLPKESLSFLAIVRWCYVIMSRLLRQWSRPHAARLHSEAGIDFMTNQIKPNQSNLIQSLYLQLRDRCWQWAEKWLWSSSASSRCKDWEAEREAEQSRRNKVENEQETNRQIMEKIGARPSTSSFIVTKAFLQSAGYVASKVAPSRNACDCIAAVIMLEFSI